MIAILEGTKVQIRASHAWILLFIYCHHWGGEFHKDAKIINIYQCQPFTVLLMHILQGITQKYLIAMILMHHICKVFKRLLWKDPQIAFPIKNLVQRGKNFVCLYWHTQTNCSQLVDLIHFRDNSLQRSCSRLYTYDIWLFDWLTWISLSTSSTSLGMSERELKICAELSSCSSSSSYKQDSDTRWKRIEVEKKIDLLVCEKRIILSMQKYW